MLVINKELFINLSQKLRELLVCCCPIATNSRKKFFIFVNAKEKINKSIGSGQEKQTSLTNQPQLINS